MPATIRLDVAGLSCALHGLDATQLPLVQRVLTYKYAKQLYGQEKFAAARAGRSAIQNVEVRCYDDSHDGFLLFNAGLISRVCTLLKQTYDVVPEIRDLSPPEKPETYRQHWDLLEAYMQFRPFQKETVEALAKVRYGRITCPPGFGKSTLFVGLTQFWRNAKIDIVAPNIAIAKTLHSGLSDVSRSVGLIGAGSKKYGDRITVYTSGSLKHSQFNADILLVDESHAMATPSVLPALGQYRRSRNYGATATNNMRYDGADLELEGILGPVVFEVPYSAVQESGAIVPIEVRWLRLPSNHNPASGLDDVQLMRRGVWCNAQRNAAIADTAKSFADEQQVLVLVDTVEHAMNLKRLLPEFSIVYGNELTDVERQYYIDSGCIDAFEPVMNADRRERLRMSFERGICKKAIATSVWNTGVDFRGLEVLIRADARASDIRSVQSAGRVSRSTEGKTSAVVYDLLDEFDFRLKSRALKRRQQYQLQGWSQKTV